MFSALKSRAAEHLQNAPGWRTKERIVVIESDDWGAVRTPDRDTLDALSRMAGLKTSLFDSLDCLESADDLACVAETLRSVKDADGRPARLTANTVLGNPDFDAVVDNGFGEFHGESLFESYRRYHGADLWPLWQSLMEEGLWRPQFHADYHLDTERWISDLQAGSASAREACRRHFYGQKQVTGCAAKNHYLAAFHSENNEDAAVKGARVMEGLGRFRDTFGFSSTTFIPCNYIWPDALDALLADAGVGARQGNRIGLRPALNEPGKLIRQRRYWQQGTTRQFGQLVRNAAFEPYVGERHDWPERALAQVQRAFWWRKPAVIATHRINYAGGLDEAHRDRSLRELRRLLAMIARRWPDVRFLSSDELLDRMTMQ